MANILSIATALPKHKHKQTDILQFMQHAYGLDNVEARKLAFLYKQSSIEHRYSVIEDFGKQGGGTNFNDAQNETLNLEQRMDLYNAHATSLSVDAIEKAIKGYISAKEITHLITVSCTGLSAPGLDLTIAETLELESTVFRTSVNFMGCYAAIHALKIAKMICDSTPNANVVVVATELCTLHFQQEFTLDNAASSLLFGDGCAAILISNSVVDDKSISLKHFYSKVSYKGKNDMSWQLSSKGFLMQLSSYVPQLIQEDIGGLVEEALSKNGLSKDDITHWCIHPGGRKILDVIQQQLHLSGEDLSCSREVLADYGNTSSASILFVLKKVLEGLQQRSATIFGVAFGPGLTMETFIASNK